MALQPRFSLYKSRCGGVLTQYKSYVSSVSRNRSRVAGLELKPQMIRYERDKFRVGGLSLGCVDGIGEDFCQHVDVAAVPRDLDRVADSSFNAG